jgi:phage tail-like protein
VRGGAAVAVFRSTPYGQFNFHVEIDGVEAAGFSEVSGVSIETEIIEYREGGMRENARIKLPGLTKYPNVTLKRGFAGSLALYEWLRAGADGNDDPRSVAIILLNEAREEVLRARLRRARIVKFTMGPLNAKGADVAIEELVLAHERLDFE